MPVNLNLRFNYTKALLNPPNDTFIIPEFVIVLLQKLLLPIKLTSPLFLSIALCKTPRDIVEIF